MSRRSEDRTLPLEVVPARTCPRKLTPGQVKRYMSTGPLLAYMIACPSCGFIEMHMQEHASFVEEEGKLVRSEKPFRCMVCLRVISIAGGSILAVASPG